MGFTDRQLQLTCFHASPACLQSQRNRGECVRNADSDAARFAEVETIALEGGRGVGWERMEPDRVDGGPGRSSAPRGRNFIARIDQTRPKQLRFSREMALGSGRRVRWEWNEVHHVAVGPGRPRALRDATSSASIDKGEM